MSQPETSSPQISRHSVDQETKLIGKVALRAFLLNLGLAVMKGMLAFHSSSLAVTAGAIDSGTDAVASLVLYGGLKLSTRKSLSFPSGLYKIENLISVFVALSIFFAGYEIAWEVVSAAKSQPEISSTVVFLLLVAVAATYALLWSVRYQDRSKDGISNTLSGRTPPAGGFSLLARGPSLRRDGLF